VVDCKSVGSGEKALIYLGCYLYRGVIAEKDIVACGNESWRFQHSSNSAKARIQTREKNKRLAIRNAMDEEVS
jgi:Putative transposase